MLYNLLMSAPTPSKKIAHVPLIIAALTVLVGLLVFKIDPTGESLDLIRESFRTILLVGKNIFEIHLFFLASFIQILDQMIPNTAQNYYFFEHIVQPGVQILMYVAALVFFYINGSILIDNKNLPRFNVAFTLLAIVSTIGTFINSTYYILMAVIGWLSLPTSAIYFLFIRYKDKIKFTKILFHSTSAFVLLMTSTNANWVSNYVGHDPSLHDHTYVRSIKVSELVKTACQNPNDHSSCPKTIEEVRALSPKDFDETAKKMQIGYHYNPEQHHFTLVLRTSAYLGFIIDNKLSVSPRRGVSFTTIGQDRVSNPPDFEGPWTFPEWEM